MKATVLLVCLLVPSSLALFKKAAALVGFPEERHRLFPTSGSTEVSRLHPVASVQLTPSFPPTTLHTLVRTDCPRCLPITHCGPVLAELHYKRPQRCGWQDHVPKVCCPETITVAIPLPGFPQHPPPPPPVSPKPEVAILPVHDLPFYLGFARGKEPPSVVESSTPFPPPLPGSPGVPVGMLPNIVPAVMVRGPGGEVGILELLPPRPSTEKTIPIRHVCGRRHYDSPWPWLVEINLAPGKEFATHLLCQGTLISDRYILTSASCVHQYKGTPEKLRVQNTVSSEENGGLEREDDPPPKAGLPIQKVFVHPYFSLGSIHDFNLAILKLAIGLPFSPLSAPVCLPGPEVRIDHFQARDAIFAAINTTNTKGRPKVQQTSLRILGSNLCPKTMPIVAQDVTGNDMDVSEGDVLCAVPSKISSGNCSDIVGAPLMLNIHSNLWILLGVNYQAVECNSNKNPSMFTDITHHLDWISANTNLP